MMLRSAVQAASETSGTGLRFIGLSIIAMVALSAISDIQRLREASVDIYTEPTNVIWSLRPDALVISGVSEKKEPCAVTYGSPVFLLAMADHGGELEPLAYPATKLSGPELEGRPLLQQGDRFIFGPWVIRDTRDMLERIQEVRVILQCEFASGVRRSTYIGPIRKPDA